jgi:putative flippase GtrA
MSQFVKYLLVGVLNTAIGYAIIFLCMYAFGFSAVISNVVGYALGMTTSYMLNQSFTFRGAVPGRGTVARFVMVSVIAYFANLGMLIFLINIFGVHEGLSQLLAGAVYVITSFLINKFYVFRFAAHEIKS